MNGAPGSLDHIGVAVRDLEQAHTVFSRLGFRLTPLSIHVGQPSADGTIRTLGSGNHCAMFRLGYMELIGVVDPDKPSSVAPFLKTRHGGFITALGCENAEAAYERAAGLFPTTQRPVALERDVEDGNGGTEKARFRNVIVGEAFPEARLLMIQHLTRDVIWRENDMAHPNGVLALLGADFVVADPVEASERYGRLAGIAPDPANGSAAVTMGGQTLRFIAADALPPSDGASPHCPSLMGAVFGVADVDATARLFGVNGVPYAGGADGSLQVPPAEACGFALTFKSAASFTS